MLTFDVDDDGLLRALKTADEGIEHFIGLAAIELEREARREGGQVTPKLGEPWDIQGVGSLERHVVAPEWWAHILAHGSKAHGPKRADRMVFAIDGDVVSATNVAGITANPFDERAVDAARTRVDDIIRAAIGGHT